jgi:UDP-N-acetylmuramoyl-L-alanyl-D-glutamate--2,6-diaminopimelate ligase
MEVSSHGIFQKRIEGVDFDVKIFTNLTQDHLDFHKTFEEYCDVKSSFFSDEKSLKIINSDDNFIKYNIKNSYTYSIKKKDSDIFANNLNFEDGILAKLFFEKNNFILKSSMIGKFNLYNILASVLAIKVLTNFSIKSILQNLEDFKGVGGRMEIIYKKNNLKVFIDYAHTPDATENVLKSIKKKEEKIFTVIGSGGDRDSSKRPIMAEIACKNSDKVFLTSDNPRFENPAKILDDMEKGVKKFSNYKIIENRKEAIFSALLEAKEKSQNGEDIIVAVLGKGSENYLDIKGKKTSYSDKEEILNFFSK